MVMHCCVEAGFQQNYCDAKPPEMLLEGFKTLNVQIWVNGLNTHGITSTKITPSASQKISGHDFPC
jgi:hypothetical protein